MQRLVNRGQTTISCDRNRGLSPVLLEDRLHSVVFTPRNGKLRVISLRKGNKREVNRYEKVVKTWKKDPQDKSGVDNSHDC